MNTLNYNIDWSTQLDNGVNSFWMDFKEFMYNRELDDHIEDVWAFLEEHSRTEIAEDVLQEARDEAAEEAYEIGREDGRDSGYESGYDDGEYVGYRKGYDEGYNTGYKVAEMEVYENL